jgi:hypothetical protein
MLNTAQQFNTFNQTPSLAQFHTTMLSTYITTPKYLMPGKVWGETRIGWWCQYITQQQPIHTHRRNISWSSYRCRILCSHRRSEMPEHRIWSAIFFQEGKKSTWNERTKNKENMNQNKNMEKIIVSYIECPGNKIIITELKEIYKITSLSVPVLH